MCRPFDFGWHNGLFKKYLYSKSGRRRAGRGKRNISVKKLHDICSRGYQIRFRSDMY